jgi:hypothetical protein
MKQLKAKCVDKPRMRSLIAKSFKKMGIEGKPIGAEKAQERIAARGVKPEDNVFSRALLRMREE